MMTTRTGRTVTRRCLAVAVATALVVGWAATSGAAPVPIGLGGLPRGGGQDDEKMAKELGLNFMHDKMRWDEDREGDYAWKEFADNDPLAARLRKLKAAGYTIAITLNNVDDDKKHMPRYLLDRAFDDPKVLQRWGEFLKAFLGRYGQWIDFLNVGDEVNKYFGGHEKEWRGFVTFVAAGAYVIRKEWPKVSLGVVLNDQDEPAKFWRDLAPSCMHYAMTYTAPCSVVNRNPTANALNPRHPKYFATVLEGAMRLAGNRRLLLTEVACPTHGSVESSPAVQARLITSLFGWLRRAESRVAGLSYAGDKDWPYDATKDTLRKMLGDQILQYRNIIWFLTSVGLRDEKGKPKPGYEAFKKGIETYRKR